MTLTEPQVGEGLEVGTCGQIEMTPWAANCACSVVSWFGWTQKFEAHDPVGGTTWSHGTFEAWNWITPPTSPRSSTRTALSLMRVKVKRGVTGSVEVNVPPCEDEWVIVMLPTCCGADWESVTATFQVCGFTPP